MRILKRLNFWRLRLRGWWWLKFGFCPACYSSPPLVDCLVCEGTREYGTTYLTPKRKQMWRNRYIAKLLWDMS